MIRFLAATVATLVAVTIGAGSASAAGMIDFTGTSSTGFLGGGGASPIPRTTVMYNGNYAPGTIVVNTAERRLYLVLSNGQALRYGIGVGRDGFRGGGVHK